MLPDVLRRLGQRDELPHKVILQTRRFRLLAADAHLHTALSAGSLLTLKTKHGNTSQNRIAIVCADSPFAYGRH